MEILITITVTFLGWLVVHILTIKRDKDKEFRDFCRETILYIQTIEKEAIEYHSSKIRHQNMEAALKADIAFLDVRFMFIQKTDPNFKNQISFFRSAITLNNFESANFSQQVSTSKILSDIIYHSRLLREDIYHSIYKK